jgi:hypothetical protein
MVGMSIRRILKHWFYPPWLVQRHFPATAMSAIAQAISDSERSHMGEVRFAVEGALPWHDVLDGLPARDRALQIFSQLRIWDTEHNNGVLIYLLLADHDVEIVADRGVHALVGPEGWEAICHAMEAEFRQGNFEAGVLLGIARITAILQQHFPAHGRDNPNELPDVPVVV